MTTPPVPALAGTWSRAERARLSGIVGAIALLHVAGWSMYFYYSNNLATAGSYAAAGVTAYALGMRKTQVMTYVLVPQAARAMLPAIVSQLVVALKDTSLGFLITYQEFLYSGKLIATNLDYDLPFIPVVMVIAPVYIGMCMLLSWCANRLARHERRRDHARGQSRAPLDLAAVEGDQLVLPRHDARIAAIGTNTGGQAVACRTTPEVTAGIERERGHGAVAVQQDHRRQRAAEAERFVQCAGPVPCHDQARKFRHQQMDGTREDAVVFLVVDLHHLQRITTFFGGRLQPGQHGHLFHAVTAPRRPEADHHDLAAQCRRAHFLTAQRPAQVVRRRGAWWQRPGRRMAARQHGTEK